MDSDKTDRSHHAGLPDGRTASNPSCPQDGASCRPTSIPRPRPRGGRRGAAAGSRRGAARRSAKARWRSATPRSNNAVRLAPTSPGVYRMLNAANDVLYVGKAKNVRKRLSSYARVNAPQPARILRMIAATVSVEIISTSTETEALLLEANLIKQLAAALQRAAARRQVVSLYPDHRRSLGAADPQASRRANPARTIFRAVRLRRRGQPHHHGAAARLPDPLLHRLRSSKAAPGRACSTRSAAAQDPAPARSIFPAIPSWCARRPISCPAAAAR